MSTPTIALPQQFRNLSGSTAATLAAVIVFVLSTLAAVLGAQVAYHQVSRTLTQVFHASGFATKPPEWVVPLLVDLSAVSPSLCTFVALCMAAGALRLVFWPTQISSAGRFPFPGAYRGFFTMFGLMGTLAGFTISFSPLDAATIEQAPFAQSQMLLAGLATALYSTLVAVVLAYGVCPPIEGMFRGLRRMRTRGRTVDVPTALQQLTQQAERAAATLAELEDSVARAAGKFDLLALEKRLGQLHAMAESTAAQLTEAAKRIETDRTAVREIFDAVMDRLRTLDDRVARAANSERRTAESVRALEKRIDGFLDALRRISR